MSNSNSILDSIGRFFSGLLGVQPPSPPAPPTPPGGVPPPPAGTPADEPLAPLTPRVLVIIYDPVFQTDGSTLTQWGQRTRGWQPVDNLIAGYIADVDECSGGLVKYQVVEKISLNEFPAKVDNFRYDAASYLATINNPSIHHEPDRIDYAPIISKFNLLQRVANNELDEVWLFTFPFSGTWESTMVGKGAFYCNSDPQPNTDSCPRRFVIMGFSYERGVGEMEEDLAHRTESIIGRVHKCSDFVNWCYAWDRSKDPYVKLDPNRYNALQFAETNLFAKFLLFDRIAPGNAQAGTVHYAPNSQKDYDWGNTTPVATYADDWLTYPNLPHVQKTQNTTSWGNGDIRGHHRWWFQRFPKVAGRTNGVRNNWWSYICNVADKELDNP